MGISGRQISLTNEAHKAWLNADQGLKNLMLSKYAEKMQITTRSLRRRFVRQGYQNASEKKSRDHCRKYPHWEAWSEAVATMKNSPPIEEGPLPTDIAIRTAQVCGLIPVEALKIPRETFDRWFRELNLIEKKGRVHRFQSNTPNEVWQFDASGSEHWSVVRQIENGDFLLRFRARSEGPLKNKEEREHRLRLKVYSIIDDASRYHLIKLIPGIGENAVDALSALDWAITREDKSKLLMHGRPTNLMIDNGPLEKNLKADDAFIRCGFGKVGRAPKNSQAGGKIERPFRTLWQRFEGSFWPQAVAMKREGKKLYITLSELSEHLHNYLVEYNEELHPIQAGWTHGLTRSQAWLKVLQTGICELPPGALFTGYKQYKKTLSSYGTFRLNGQEWEVKGAHSIEGYVYQDIKGNLYFNDLHGHGYRVVPYTIDDFRVYKANKQGPRKRLIEDHLPANVSSIYGESKTQHNITSMPPRVSESVEPDKPYTEPGYFPDFDTALRHFISRIDAIRWRDLSQEGKETCKQHIMQNLRITRIDDYADNIIEKTEGEAYG